MTSQLFLIGTLVAMGLFMATLGYVSITDALRFRRSA